MGKEIKIKRKEQKDNGIYLNLDTICIWDMPR